MFDLLMETLQYVAATLIHNAPVLALGILVAAIVKVYADPDKFRQVLMKSSGVSIPATVAFGAFTPFCACGTMAVIVSMLTTALPWGPIMAFLTSSPLMSPDGFILNSGIIGFDFAVALAAASIIIGLGSGYMTHLIENHTHFLDDQARFAEQPIKAACSCPEAAVASPACGCGSAQNTSCCSTAKKQTIAEKYRLKELFRVFFDIGVKKVLVYFSIFAAVGFMINKFVPAAMIMKYMGSGNIFAVPMLALIGLPLYVSGSSSLPVINSLMAGGASSGALLAFMITGPGTSAGVLAGITTIMKGRAIALYAAYLIFFAIVLGYLYDFLLMSGIV